MAPRFRRLSTRHPGGRQILVDVSTIVKGDSRTGIQRVVRAIIGKLYSLDINGATIQPVFANRNHGYCKAIFLPDGELVNAGRNPRELLEVDVRKGDVFLGLDLAAQTLPCVERQISSWRARGVAIHIVIYDLLPIKAPNWFSDRLAKNFQAWFGVVSRQSDCCICISKTVERELEDLFAANTLERTPAIRSIPLGSDLGASYPSTGLPDDYAELRDWIRSRRTLMAVGTIEPRKGYERLLDALEHLWLSDPQSDVALIIVGRAGWRTERLQERIRNNPEQSKRLVWVDQASDELLSKLYRDCVGLVAASHQEGFGLPLVEAVAHGAPVLARDIPVFREVGGALFDYFDDDSPAPFAARIMRWLDDPKRPTQVQIASLARWEDSATALVALLDLSQARIGNRPG